MKQISYIGVDIGTTTTKAVGFDEQGQVLVTAYQGYPLFCPDPLTAEQDPKLIFEAVLASIQQVATCLTAQNRTVRLVAFSSAMHGVILVDKTGKPLTHCLTWADGRSGEVAQALKNTPEGIAFYHQTGTPIHAMSPLVKLRWLQQNEPQLMAKCHLVMDIKSYVFYRLTGKYLTDYSLASGTGMLAMTTLTWDEGALAYAGITSEQLPRLVDTTYIEREISSYHLQAMGLPLETPFIIGASDGALSNLGIGAIGANQMGLTIGTSAAIRKVVSAPMTSPNMATFCYYLTKDHWVTGGASNNGGVALTWLRQAFFEEQTYEDLIGLAETAGIGAGGLLFLPYLSGERAPLWNSNSRGTYHGWSLAHGKHHMVRATMEGVVMNLKLISEAIGTGQLIATGGFVRSPLWRQMVSDVFNQPVTIPENMESSCWGAVLLGQLALGDRTTLVQDMKGTMAHHHHHPQPEAVATYQTLMPIYQGLVTQLKGQYDPLADFQRRIIWN